VLAAHRGAAAPPTKKQVSDTVAGLRYTTERLARDALAEIQNGMVSGTFVSRSTLTVEQACAEWLAGRHSIRPTIRAGYEHALSALRHRHGARTTFAPGLRPDVSGCGAANAIVIRLHHEVADGVLADM